LLPDEYVLVRYLDRNLVFDVPETNLLQMNSETQPGIAGTVRGRLIRGFGATALSPVVTAIVQIVSVPVFLHFWGVKLYGEWLIISAIPTYLALSDVGFGSVAANDMTMRVAAGDRDGALETYQSTRALISVTSVLAGIALLSVIWLLPLTRWLNLSSMAIYESRATLSLLLVYALVSLQAGLFMSGFRCDGNYAFGILVDNLIRLTEFVASMVAIALYARPMAVGAALLAARILGTIVMGWLMLRKSPWLRHGIDHVRMASVRRLALPAFAYMAFPAGNALSVQGMVVVIGLVLGPVAVTTFSAMRTLTRFALQIAAIITLGVYPELSAAFGAQNWNLARKLHRIACQASLWLSLAAVVFLFVAGDHIFRFWTHGRVAMDVGAFRWLLLVIVANSFWYASSVVTMASNTHERVAAFYLVGTAGSLILARYLMPHFGISGAAMSLLVIDIVLGWYVVRMSLAKLEDRATDFGTALLRLPREVALLRSLGWSR
jgi:O-antigen/teichoic acid export membrane protein